MSEVEVKELGRLTLPGKHRFENLVAAVSLSVVFACYLTTASTAEVLRADAIIHYPPEQTLDGHVVVEVKLGVIGSTQPITSDIARNVRFGSEPGQILTTLVLNGSDLDERTCYYVVTNIIQNGTKVGGGWEEPINRASFDDGISLNVIDVATMDAYRSGELEDEGEYADLSATTWDGKSFGCW